MLSQRVAEAFDAWFARLAAARGVRLVVEAKDGGRVRAVRGAYSEGIAVKAMSEDLILARLDEDLARTFG